MGCSMRSDLLRDLFQAHAENNSDKFIEVANEIIKDEERKKHHLLALDLKKMLHDKSQTSIAQVSYSKRYKTNIPIPRDTEKGFPLLEIKEQYFSLEDLILNEEVKEGINRIISEINSLEILETYGLRPKQKILFCGLPGTGKTLSSKVISSIIGYPLVHIRFDSIVSSYLGETATNLRKIFNFINQGEWVVLFDEFDIIGKKRDDPYEHGEIKRVVNNFMQMLDDYSGESLLIAATNHHYLLDSAMWRRFDDILYFDLPDLGRRIELFNKYLKVLRRSKDINIHDLAKATNDFSPADIAQVCEEALRRVILDKRIEILQEDINWSIKQQLRKKDIIRKE
jgi:SpoVK/Ycf46/Vps4 family AAA+-type ATPase